MKQKNNAKKENKMGVMPIKKLVITMSLPIMISMLVQSLYNIVDSIFVAKISENALTATSIAYSAQILQIAVAVGTGVGVNALVSRTLGAKHFEKVNQAATTGLFLTIASSLIFVLWGIFGTEPFIKQFTDNPNIISKGTAYLQICQIFSTGIFLGTLTQRLLQATGKTFSSMVAQLFGAVVNIILDPIMIFGMFGFPKMGIAGAIGLIGTCVFMICPQLLLSLFSASNTMISIGKPALRIISVSFIFASLTLVIGYLISGLGNGMVNMLSTVIRQLIVLLPCVILLGQLGNIHYVWFAFWVSEFLAFLFAWYSLKKELAKKILPLI